MEFTLEHRLQKRSQTQSLMKDHGIQTWVLWVEDNAAEDAHLPLIGAPYGSARKAYIITPERAVSICPEIEAQLQADAGFEVISVPDRNVIGPFGQHFKEIAGGRPTPIALNYSGTFGALDTLGFGNYQKIREAISRQYFFPVPQDAFVSADRVIIDAASAKLPFEIELIREAAQLTYKVLDEGFRQLRAGMTEKDAAAVFHRLAEEEMGKNKAIGYSWKKEYNPIVLTGEGIAGSPHAAPSDRVIVPGSTVYIDFGLSMHRYGGDLQHFGYVLKEGEAVAPPEIQRMYEILVNSIHAGMKAAVPGVPGWVVDTASRKIITDAGYPSFKHGTGHQLGAGNTHAPGAAFALQYTQDGRESPEACLPIRKGFVMTIEPRMQVTNGASIEVDGVITDNGFELLAPLQEEIYLIR